MNHLQQYWSGHWVKPFAERFVKAFVQTFAQQLRYPSGWMGQILLLFLNRENATMNQLVVEHLELKPQQAILEMGFGGGDLFARLLNAKIELQIAGIDPSPTSIAMVKKRFRRPITLGQITLHQSSADAIPFTDNMFDAIATVNTLYFWSDVSDVLKECRRVLKPGGKVAIAYTSKEFLEDHFLTQHGFQSYSDQELETFLVSLGFTQVRTVSGTSRQNGAYFCTFGVSGTLS